MNIGLAWGLALSSGVNTYLPLFLLALFARYSHLVQLSSRFGWLISDQALIILGLLAASEVLAQKVPVLDHVWDFIHTFLRPLAGALAAGVTLTTDRTFAVILTLLIGGALATAAHSAKSGVRLLSTAKTLGAANPLLSLLEDGLAVLGTLLSIYVPWVMLAIVLLFVLFFLFAAPRLLRALRFNSHLVAHWLVWIWQKVGRQRPPINLDESLLEVPPARLGGLREYLETGEELLGILCAWNRSSRGPRRGWLLITPRRLLWVEGHLLRKPRVQTIHSQDLILAHKEGTVFSMRLEIITRQRARYVLSLAKTQMGFAELALETLRERACETLGPRP